MIFAPRLIDVLSAALFRPVHDSRRFDLQFRLEKGGMSFRPTVRYRLPQNIPQISAVTKPPSVHAAMTTTTPEGVSMSDI